MNCFAIKSTDEKNLRILVLADEMEKKGLRLFPHYQNFPAVSHKTQAPESCLESWNHSRSKNMSIIPQPLPISCGGQFTISAELHSIDLVEKPGVARDQSEFHYKEGPDSNQRNSRTHPVSLVPGTEKSKSVANQELAEPDQEQSTSSPEEFNGSPMQYEDALSVYEVRSEERRVGKEGRSRWSPYH